MAKIFTQRSPLPPSLPLDSFGDLGEGIHSGGFGSPYDEFTVSAQHEFWLRKSEASIPDSANIQPPVPHEAKGPEDATECEESDDESVISRSTFTEETSSTVDAQH